MQNPVQLVTENSSRKKHQFLTIADKISIVKAAQICGSLREYSRVCKVSHQNISNWTKQLNEFEKVKNPQRKRIIVTQRKRKYPNEEDEVAKEVRKMISKNEIVTTSIIKQMFFNKLRFEGRTQMVDSYVKNKMWVYRFMKKYNFTIRKTTIKNTKPFDMNNPEKQQEVKDYFNKLAEKLQSYEDKAILNMDETAINYESIPNHVVVSRGSKEVNAVDVVNAKQGFTGVVTVSKDGTLLKPMAIFPHLKKQPFTRIECHVSVSESGKMNQELMKEWYDNVILPYMRKNNLERCLLICDNYGSHKTEDVIRYMNKLDILFLPSNTTPFLQPLDANFFSLLKRQLVKDWLKDHHDVSKLNEQEKKKQTSLKVRRRKGTNWFIDGCKTIQPITIKRSFHMCGILKNNEQVLAQLNSKLQQLKEVCNM